MQQVLLLPHFLVGRFDLAIKFIYQGLLLGTGPQVDPGFQGALSCPLHNISNEEIVIELGESFAKIDFAKTVPRPLEVREAWSGLETEKDLARWIEDQPPTSYSRVFKEGRPKWRRPIYDYLLGKKPTSSVKALKKRLDKYRNIGVGGLVTGVLAVLVGVPGLVFFATEFFAREKADSSAVSRVERESAARSQALRKQIQELEREMAKTNR